ncbi:MAG: hypothetical protein LC747_00780 [Acidobacteria bacterium]|nr:hypothetical protein [Acidobacteriota bacterium]
MVFIVHHYGAACQANALGARENRRGSFVKHTLVGGIAVKFEEFELTTGM